MDYCNGNLKNIDWHFETKAFGGDILSKKRIDSCSFRASADNSELFISYDTDKGKSGEYSVMLCKGINRQRVIGVSGVDLFSVIFRGENRCLIKNTEISYYIL